MKNKLPTLGAVTILFLNSEVCATSEITYDQAHKIAEKEVGEYYRGRYDVDVPEKYVEKRGDGWIFYAVPKKYMETGDDDYLLLGGYSYFVGRDGRLVKIPSEVNTQDKVDEYIKTH